MIWDSRSAWLHTICKYKLSYNKAQTLWMLFTDGPYYVPAHSREPLEWMWQQYFSIQPSTYTEFIKQTETWRFVMDHCTPEDEQRIQKCLHHQQITSKLQSIRESKILAIHPS